MVQGPKGNDDGSMTTDIYEAINHEYGRETRDDNNIVAAKLLVNIFRICVT